MEMSEKTFLLDNNYKIKGPVAGLSVPFAIICMVDVFGVFPIVSLPKNIIQCGIYSVPLLIVVGGLQIYTAILLGRCWLIAEDIDPTIMNKNRYPYSALTELAFGSHISKFVTFLLDITVFGGGIPNLIVASQTLQLLGMRLTDDTFNLSFCYWIVIIGMILCPLMWLGSPKDMKLVCSISVTIVLLVFTLVWSCIIFYSNTPSQQETTWPVQPLWQNMIAAYGILTFQFDVHPTILTIQVDMKNKKKISEAIKGAFLVSMGMFVLISVSAWSKYGFGVHASLLGTLQSSIPLHIAALLVALQLGLTSAVSNNALYQHMEDCLGISREFNHKRCILRTTLSIIAIILAESVPRLEIIMSLIGGTFIGPLVFIFPPLLFIRILSMKRSHDDMVHLETFRNIVYNTAEITAMSTIETEKETVESSRFENLEVSFCICVVLFGAVGTICTTYVNIQNTIEFATFSQPCIYNLTIVSPF